MSFAYIATLGGKVSLQLFGMVVAIFSEGKCCWCRNCCLVRVCGLVRVRGLVCGLVRVRDRYL